MKRVRERRGVHYFATGRKKAIASSTIATSNFLCVLKEEASSWEELKKKICDSALFDEEALKIVEKYEELKVSFDEVIFGRN